MTKVHDREQVIDAAARVFAEKGFEAARLEEIAAELGILKGSLYYHATSKAELLFLVMRKRLLTIVARAERIAASRVRPADKLAEALRAHLHHLAEFSPESAQWFVQPSRPRGKDEHRSEIRTLYRHYESVLRGILREGVEAGEFRADLDLKVATLGVLGMCNWLPRWYHKDGRLSIDAIGDTYVCMLIDGLRSDTAATGALDAKTRPATGSDELEAPLRRQVESAGD